VREGGNRFDKKSDVELIMWPETVCQPRHGT
jgi:hypothetical protein